jgi:hypothetical protein
MSSYDKIQELQRECTRWEKKCLIIESQRDSLKAQIQELYNKWIVSTDYSKIESARELKKLLWGQGVCSASCTKGETEK